MAYLEIGEWDHYGTEPRIVVKIDGSLTFHTSPPELIWVLTWERPTSLFERGRLRSNSTRTADFHERMWVEDEMVREVCGLGIVGEAAR